jgi:electron transfer flavoprotein alpha subunit
MHLIIEDGYSLHEYADALAEITGIKPSKSTKDADKADLLAALKAVMADIWYYCEVSPETHGDRVITQKASNAARAAIAQAAKKLEASVVILSHSSNGKSLIGNIAYLLDAGSVSAAVDIPETDKGFSVRKGVYSSKALVNIEINTPVKVVSVLGNSLQISVVGSNVEVQPIALDVLQPGIKFLSVDKLQSNVTPLPEAERVVSGGRGLKGPENWGIVEELADVLHATTACSRPVSDADWRPHHEHVGQTGIAIRPNLYIAIGISGAIQHLAGVNNSKTIVVINKDPEAPFFKSANYGVVGDLFDIVPKLTAAIKNLNA